MHKVEGGVLGSAELPSDTKLESKVSAPLSAPFSSKRDVPHLETILL